MFSGIIEKKAKILEKNGGRFRVENIFEEGELTVGQSIAHDGACMTLTSIEKDAYEFFVMEESLNVTNFREKQVGDFFNIERSLRVGDRLDWHIVSGHVDTVGTVKKLEKNSDGSLLLRVAFDPKYDIYTIQKGSIALNWVSLTIVETSGGEVTVSLIPLTQDWTNLWAQDVWNLVNIEFDMLGKYILKSEGKHTL